MIVNAYTYGAGTKIELGNIADSIWVQGFKFSQSRAIQVSKPINAPAPNLFDRLTRTAEFSFAAGRSFTTVGDALNFMGSHAGNVPGLADLQFQAGSGEQWLRYCGIVRVELIDKKGALIVFGYTITGGTWAATRQ